MVVTPAATIPFRWFRTWRTIWPLRLIFSISSGDLRMIRSSPKLIINSCCAALLPAAVLAMTFDDGKNLYRNLGHWPIRIDCYQTPLRAIVIRHPPGLRLVSRQPARNNFLAVVVADHQLRSVHITQLVRERWLGVNVIEPSTGGTRSPPGKPLQQLSIVHEQLDHNQGTVLRIFKDLIFQESVQPSCLSGRSRKAVQHKPALAIGFPQPRGYDA